MFKIRNIKKDILTSVLGVGLIIGVLVARFIPSTGTTWSEVLLVSPVGLGLLGVDRKQVFKKDPDNESA